jgi:hypothetical protein
MRYRGLLCSPWTTEFRSEDLSDTTQACNAFATVWWSAVQRCTAKWQPSVLTKSH